MPNQRSKCRRGDPRNVPLTYAGVTDRRRFLVAEEGKYLLDTLPADIGAALTKSFLETGLDSPEKEILLRHLLQHSTITQMVKESSTSSLTFEYLYRKKPVDNEIDAYFPRGKATVGIFERLVSLKENLPGIIRREMQERRINGRKFQILNVGSGPGHDTIEMLAENHDLVERVHVICLDPDKEALDIGRKRAMQLDLTRSITFVDKGLQEYGPASGADMILMIGLLCPMPNEACHKILKNSRVFARHDGLVLFSTVQRPMVEDDPLTDFIMRVAGWRMHYKEDHEPDEIARMAGWRPIDRFHDRLGYNCMTVAKLERDWRNTVRRALHPLYRTFKRVTTRPR